MTSEVICQALGLSNHEHYAAYVRTRNRVKIGKGELHPKNIDRSIGSSTKLICSALEKIQDGNPIWFVSFRYYWAERTCLIAKRYARRLGLDDGLIFNGPDTPEYLAGKDPSRLFHDPYEA